MTHESIRARVTIGLIDGSVESTSRRFSVVLNADAVVQLDDLVSSGQRLPDGTEVSHYGIVVEGFGEIEGAELASDTRRITAERTMPGDTTRRVDVQVLRTMPEMWLPPDPGAVVERVPGKDRDLALFVDQMEHPLALGLDAARQPVYADFSFINGEKGGHISISGISGVATKTSYALFTLYMLFETPQGRALLGAHAPNTKAPGLQRQGGGPPSSRPAEHEVRHHGWCARRMGSLGRRGAWAIPVCPVLFAPVGGRSRRIERDRRRVTGCHRRPPIRVDARTVHPRGSPPVLLCRGGGHTNTDLVHRAARKSPACKAHASARWRAGRRDSGPAATGHDLRLREAPPQPARHPTRERRRARPRFGELVDFLTAHLTPPNIDPDWSAGVAEGTCLAFLRRLYGAAPRLGNLVQPGVEAVEMAEAVTVVDIHALHDAAQRFVVGALTSALFEEKQGRGREPLRFIVLDELNKYAPREGRSPIKDVLVDIAARGRSLGVILIGAQQSATEVEPAIVRNASVKVVGRLDAGESADYRFLTPEVRERATRFLPGTMVLDQPLVPAPIPIRFPFPAFATSVGEDASGSTASTDDVDELFSNL